MPREPAFDVFYHDTHDRLWLQVYAYAGDVDLAEHAVAAAYASASQHWRAVMQSPDREAWVRVKAFEEVRSGRTDNQDPWFVRARKTADEHRPLLKALASLRPVDRALLIGRHLVGLDTGAAAREVGLTVSAAQASLDASAATLRRAGLDSSPAGISAGLRGLSTDQPDAAGDPAALRLRTRRRRRLVSGLVTGVVLLVVAMGVAFAWTSARSDDDDSADADPPATTEPGPETSAPTTAAPQPPAFSTADLAGAAAVKGLDRGERWRVMDTTSDFGVQKPPDVCVAALPQSADTDHYWVREFRAGKGSGATTATQVLEIANNPTVGAATYAALVRDFGACGDQARQLVTFASVKGAADGGTTIGLRYVDRDGVRSETVAVGRSGSAVTTWIVRSEAEGRPSERSVLSLLSASLDSVCRDADGQCPARRLRSADDLAHAPVPEGGFLTTSDLPVLAGIPKPWAATAATRTPEPDPAATQCDPDDPVSASAARARTRTYVIPNSARLPTIFGISQTLATFDARRDASRYLESVRTAVAGCEERVPGITVRSVDGIGSDRLGYSGFVWEIQQAASEDEQVLFRTALVQVRKSVAEVTFTPGGYDVGPDAYRALASRVALRLAQLPAR